MYCATHHPTANDALALNKRNLSFLLQRLSFQYNVSFYDEPNDFSYLLVLDYMVDIFFLLDDIAACVPLVSMAVAPSESLPTVIMHGDGTGTGAGTGKASWPRHWSWVDITVRAAADLPLEIFGYLAGNHQTTLCTIAIICYPT